MREILFRGQRYDGVWVEGYLFAKPILEKYFILCGEEQWMVKSETIGQHTGLLDKNGNKIFEGDILRFHGISNYPVFWDADYGAFGSCYYSDFEILSHYNRNKIEIIGNIHDNPELLE